MTISPVINIFDRFMYAYLKETSVTSLAVAVSGGPDSMALLKCAGLWAEKEHVKIHAVTIDHGLRTAAAVEAAQVAEFCIHNGIGHTILKPEQEIGAVRVQETARRVRYDLIEDYMKAHGIRHLLLGHHLNDQFETFLMRLGRGSDLKGLCGISPVQARRSIILMRPFLSVEKEALIRFCQDHRLPIANDPSNRDVRYQRAHVRRHYSMLEQVGLDVHSLETTRQKLTGAEDFVQSTLQPLRSAFFTDMRADIPADQFNGLHDYIRIRLVTDALMHVGASTYPPRYKSVTGLIDRMIRQDFSGATLNNCHIRKKDDKFTFTAEV